MNREEILERLLGRHNITFGTYKAPTAEEATRQIEMAKKTEYNISNLIERLTVARNAGFEVSICPAFTSSDFFIHRTDTDNATKLTVIFGSRLLDMIGAGSDPIAALEVAHEQAEARVAVLQKHLEWLREDINITLTDDQKRRIRNVIEDTRPSESEKQVFKMMTVWLTEYKKNPGTWRGVVNATKTLPLYMRQSTFLLGYMAHVFIDEVENDGT